VNYKNLVVFCKYIKEQNLNDRVISLRLTEQRGSLIVLQDSEEIFALLKN